MISDATSNTLIDIDRPVAWRWAALMITVAASLMIVMAVPALAEWVQPLDDWGWEAAVDSEADILVAIGRALDVIGGSVVMAALMFAVAIIFGIKRRWATLATWLVAMGLSQLLSLSLKFLYERPRPTQSLVETATWSFPSGHSITAAVFAVALVLLWVPKGHRRRKMLVVGVAYAVIMAVSRVYLRAHWITDASAGFAIGVGTAVVVILAMNKSSSGGAEDGERL